MIPKLNYFLLSLKKYLKGQGFNCPSCNSNESNLIKRKYFVTSLRRCKSCHLLFRAPTTSAEENEKFYEKSYKHVGSQGFSTDCPDDKTLSKLLETKFLGHERDYSNFINIIFTATSETKQKLFEYGCSWGYGSWQLKDFGFEVDSYEISPSRAKFASQKLKINTLNNLNSVNKNYYDIFFSSHVLEHVPSVDGVVKFGFSILKKEGLFIVFTPNGSLEHKSKNKNWNKLWGMVHPNFLDNKFYKNYFKDMNYYIASSPYKLDEIKKWNENNNKQFIGDLHGDELLVIVKK